MVYMVLVIGSRRHVFEFASAGLAAEAAASIVRGIDDPEDALRMVESMNGTFAYKAGLFRSVQLTMEPQREYVYTLPELQNILGDETTQVGGGIGGSAKLGEPIPLQPVEAGLRITWSCSKSSGNCAAEFLGQGRWLLTPCSLHMNAFS